MRNNPFLDQYPHPFGQVTSFLWGIVTLILLENRYPLKLPKLLEKITHNSIWRFATLQITPTLT